VVKSSRLPKKATRHITNPHDPLGWVRNQKIKTLDSDTQKVAWKSVRRGLLLDNQGGEPTSQNTTAKDAKITRTHSVHTGNKTHTTRNSDG
jgi:hypothetical protein